MNIVSKLRGGPAGHVDAGPRIKGGRKKEEDVRAIDLLSPSLFLSFRSIPDNARTPLRYANSVFFLFLDFTARLRPNGFFYMRECARVRSFVRVIPRSSYSPTDDDILLAR